MISTNYRYAAQKIDNTLKLLICSTKNRYAAQIINDLIKKSMIGSNY